MHVNIGCPIRQALFRRARRARRSRCGRDACSRGKHPRERVWKAQQLARLPVINAASQNNTARQTFCGRGLYYRSLSRSLNRSGQPLQARPIVATRHMAIRASRPDVMSADSQADQIHWIRSKHIAHQSLISKSTAQTLADRMKIDCRAVLRAGLVEPNADQSHKI